MTYDDPENVVEVLTVNRDARVFLLLKERAQLRQRCIRGNRDHVGARGHDFPHQCVAEVDDRLQQLAFVSLDQPLFLAGVGIAVRAPGGLLFRRRWSVDVLTLASRFGNQSDETAGQRPHGARHDIEGREDDFEHALGVTPNDPERHQVLADDDENRDGQQEQTDGLQTGTAGADGDQHGRQRENQTEQEPYRDEELYRIFQVVTKTVIASASLGHQSQRQLHQGAESRLDGADVNSGKREQKNEEWNHERAISPRSRPPLLRSLASARAIRPLSARSS